MRAIILAAGRGMRLQQPGEQQLPKCLLPFDGRTLLERHLRLLRKAGAVEVVLALGFRHDLVKVCVRDGIPVELRKQLAPGLQYDTIGESVGFFRFDPAGARRLATLVAGYVESGRANMPHEEAVRDLLLERSQIIDVADVS